jgi:hypothetical protein
MEGPINWLVILGTWDVRAAAKSVPPDATGNWGLRRRVLHYFVITTRNAREMEAVSSAIR